MLLTTLALLLYPPTVGSKTLDRTSFQGLVDLDGGSSTRRVRSFGDIYGEGDLVSPAVEGRPPPPVAGFSQAPHVHFTIWLILSFRSLSKTLTLFERTSICAASLEPTGTLDAHCFVNRLFSTSASLRLCFSLLPSLRSRDSSSSISSILSLCLVLVAISVRESSETSNQD